MVTNKVLGAEGSSFKKRLQILLYIRSWSCSMEESNTPLCRRWSCKNYNDHDSVRDSGWNSSGVRNFQSIQACL